MNTLLDKWQDENILLATKEERLVAEQQQVQQEINATTFQLTEAKKQLAAAKQKEALLLSQQHMKILAMITTIFLVRWIVGRILQTF